MESRFNITTHDGFVSIDPGRDTGFAVYVRDAAGSGEFRLIGAGVVHSDARTVGELASDIAMRVRREAIGTFWRVGTNANVPGRCIGTGVELMEFRPDDVRSKAEDLIQVATVGAFVAGALRFGNGAAVFVRPSEWKGAVPKDVHFRRATAVLSESELLCLRRDFNEIPGAQVHNASDAVALGLFLAGRLRRGGG